MQKIKVARIESKPTTKGGTVVALFDEKNTRFSGFLKELQDVKEGDTVEAEIQVDGKYNNITALKVVQHDAAPAPTRANGNGNHCESPDARASIETQTAYKGVIDLLANKVIPVDHPLARNALKWAWDRLPKAEAIKREGETAK